jgi:hypothetical protein
MNINNIGLHTEGINTGISAPTPSPPPPNFLPFYVLPYDRNVYFHGSVGSKHFTQSPQDAKSISTIVRNQRQALPEYSEQI